jgi:hypothetical protein
VTLTGSPLFSTILYDVGVFNPFPRFWSKVAVSDDWTSCWEWSRRKDKWGYGQFTLSFPRKTCFAHRFALGQAGVVVPSDLLVMHHCDNPLCCNPMHLTLGTHLDNARDRVMKGRSYRQSTASNSAESFVGL